MFACSPPPHLSHTGGALALYTGSPHCVSMSQGTTNFLTHRGKLFELRRKSGGDDSELSGVGSPRRAAIHTTGSCFFSLSAKVAMQFVVCNAEQTNPNPTLLTTTSSTASVTNCVSHALKVPHTPRARNDTVERARCLLEVGPSYFGPACGWLGAPIRPAWPYELCRCKQGWGSRKSLLECTKGSASFSLGDEIRDFTPLRPS